METWTPGTGQETVMVFVNPIYVGGLEIAENPNTNLSGLGITTVSEGVLSLGVDQIRTNEIKPFEGQDVAVQLGNENTTNSESGFGKLLITNRDGQTVASVDEQGNASFSGELVADSIVTEGFETDVLSAETASVSGELQANIIRADQIISPDLMTRDEIEAMLSNVTNNENMMNDSQNWTATGSASMTDLSLENLFVTGTAAVNSLSAMESITVGNDLAISANNAVNSIDTLNAPLSIQSSATQPLYLMAGLVQIDTSGNVSIAGNLNVAGTIESAALTLRETTANAITGFGKILSVQDVSGSTVAQVTATGAAEFASVTTDALAVKADQTATSSATLSGTVFTSNASAGSAAIESGSRQVVIQNSKVKAETLIFVTATSETTEPIFVKEKSDGGFVVGFANDTTSNVTFNWWIVDVQ